MLNVPQPGGSKKASVSEQIGITDVVIHYGRPALKGREGKVWGQLVAYGFTDLVYGSSKSAPWRAGANENTTIEFSTPVKVEGQLLDAGIYGFHIAVAADECTLIFSKDHDAWGSYFYDAKNDALRVKVRPVPIDKSVEYLRYEFLDQTDTSAVIALEWEKLRIPFRVTVDYVNTQLASFRKQLMSHDGFDWHAYLQAAQFAVQHKANLEEALVWANIASGKPGVGEKNFSTLSVRSQVLQAMGRTAEADSVLKAAIPLGTKTEIHNYARQLLSRKKGKEAFEAFKINYDKYPGDYTAMVGMGRGFSAIGEYKKAIAILQKATKSAPDETSKANLGTMLKKLQDGKDIN